ncbi:MAG TPA: hypothetical protein VI078_10065 [bacterium]
MLLALVLAALVAAAPSQAGAALLGNLLRTEDFETIGLKGVTLAPPDDNRAERLTFEKVPGPAEKEEQAERERRDLGGRRLGELVGLKVLVFSRLDTGAGTLRSTLEATATDLIPVAGVGDEAYSYLGGTALAFRKGTAAFRMMSGDDFANRGKAFLTQDQLAALAKIVCTRL